MRIRNAQRERWEVSTIVLETEPEHRAYRARLGHGTSPFKLPLVRPDDQELAASTKLMVVTDIDLTRQ